MPSTVESHFEPQTVIPTSKAGREAPKNLDIIDIRLATVESNLKENIHQLFKPKKGPRKLPTLLLYSKNGLQLYEKITYLDEYYLTNCEIEVLQTNATKIALAISPGSMVIELGSGNLRKVCLLLQAFEDAGKEIDYYALDLSQEELERTIAEVPTYKHVRVHGLLGTYDDGQEWLKQPDISARRKCVLSLGSSIGNFYREDAVLFLKGFSDVLQPDDCFLIGLDLCVDPSKIYHAYNDRKGVTHQFVLEGLVHANRVLGSQAFNVNDWHVIGEYVYDEKGGRHQVFLSPRVDVSALGETVKAGERIQIEQSLKYTMDGMENLWNTAGLLEVDRWMTRGDDYGIHLLTKPTAMLFGPKSSEYDRHVLPSPGDWKALWQTWDTVTQRMLPNEELHEKPIKLRNACIFYLGHIPTFLDIQLTKTTKTPPTDPASFWAIFERGIDPDVENPELCHDHSEIPDEWPSVDKILQYQERVRAKLTSLYSGGQARIPRDIGRAISVAFEHEVMHLETLLYILLQSDKTLPPPHKARPDFAELAQKTSAERVENQWFTIPEQKITIGLDDPEDKLDSTGHFGWDNEKPSRQVNVHSFQAKGRPITNEEYANYMYDTNLTKLPASWAERAYQANGSRSSAKVSTNGSINGHTQGHANGHANGVNNGTHKPPTAFLEGKAVRTIYGLVPLNYALDWPVMASYNELSGCVAWMGGRIPTMEEARSIYTHVDNMRKEKAENQSGKMVSAVEGRLVNDGVEETPPSHGTKSVNGDSSEKDEIFADLTDANA